jgi:hypothetical protein
MTFKQFCNSNPTLPLNTLREQWGRIQKALQSDMAKRFGDLTGAKFRSQGKVRIIEGQAYSTIRAEKLVESTVADIRAEEQRVADASARRLGKLAEVKAIASEEGRKGLDLVELCKASDSKPEPVAA